MAARYPAETQCPGHASAVFSWHHVETAQRHRWACSVRTTLRYAIDRKRSICEQATSSYWPIGTRHQLVSVRCKMQIWQTPVARNRGSRAHEFAGMHAILNAHRPLQRDCASMVDGVCFTIVGNMYRHGCRDCSSRDALRSHVRVSGQSSRIRREPVDRVGAPALNCKLLRSRMPEGRVPPAQRSFFHECDQT